MGWSGVGDGKDLLRQKRRPGEHAGRPLESRWNETKENKVNKVHCLQTGGVPSPR